MEGLIALTVQHDLTVHVSVLVVALLHLPHAVHGHGLTLGVHIAVPDDMLLVVVATLNPDDPLRVRGDVAVDVIVGFRGHVSRLIEGPVNPAVAVPEQHRLILEAEPTLGNLLLRIVKGDAMLGPAVRVQRARPVSVVQRLPVQVAGLVVALLHIGDAVDGHHIALVVLIGIPHDAVFVIVSP